MHTRSNKNSYFVSLSTTGKLIAIVAAMFAPRDSPAPPQPKSRVISDKRFASLRKSINKYGFGVLEGFIEPQVAQSMVATINHQVKDLVEAYGNPIQDDRCTELMSLGKELHASPTGWVSPERPNWRIAFAPYRNRGWIQALGAGKMFDGEDFTGDGQVVELQEQCRCVFAFLHGVQPDKLQRVNERVSVKPSGSPKLKAHIDGNRRGSYQAVICLSDSSFLVYPHSHKAAFLPKTNNYHALSTYEIKRLGEEVGSFEKIVPSKVGDVLFFVGGDFVHGSVAINTDEPSRYAAYAQFWPMEEHAKRKREEAAQLATPRKLAKRGEAAQLATPQKPASKVSSVHATLAAAVGRPHRSGARWSSNQLQAWMMQLPQHTRDMCSKTGRLYVCQICGRLEKTLTLMEEVVCPGFIPDTSIKTKLRKCITWCRKNGSMEEGSMEVRKPRGNPSMRWLVEHQMEVIPMEGRLPPRVFSISSSSEWSGSSSGSEPE